MKAWYNMFIDDKRLFYINGETMTMHDLLIKYSNYYDVQASWHNVITWLDFAKISDSTKLRKIDAVLVRIK